MSSRFVAALILALAAAPALAQTYKWVDAKGQVNYSNTPPPTVADRMQPVEERISVMGMDPAVRASAERRFAAKEYAEELDWLRRQQAMNARYASYTPASRGSLTSSYLSPYSSTYYPGYTYAAIVPTFFATASRGSTFPSRPMTSGGGHRHHHHRR